MPTLHDYQLFLFDVDKTLTNSRREITPRTQAALKKIIERNIRIGVCTGRGFPVLQNLVFPFFPADAVHVVSGGAQVITNTGEVLWEQCISHEIVAEIIPKAQIFDVGFLLSQGDTVFINEKMNQIFEKRLDYLKPKKEFYTVLKDFSTPVMPVVDAPLEFFNYLNERNDVSYKQMKTYEGGNADITAKGVNKSSGLQQLSTLLHIPLVKILGVGDSENDDEFLQTVGYKVAMGNATDYLKSIANRTIGTADEDGLAIYLEHILEGGEL